MLPSANEVVYQSVREDMSPLRLIPEESMANITGHPQEFMWATESLKLSEHIPHVLTDNHIHLVPLSQVGRVAPGTEVPTGRFAEMP